MAVLKDLIVHGRSRFVNGAQFNTINAESIGATQGIFNELIATTLEAKNATIDDLTANNATVVGLLDVQGELHTNSWTNANIANIGGSFYISPTVEPTDGSTTITITRNSATSWTISAAGTFATDFVKSDKATAGVNWPVNSLVLITGDVVVGDMVYPLGTLKGTLSATVTASAASTSKTITITGVTDAQNNSSPSVLQQLYEINNNQNISGVAFKNGKISLYKLGSYPIGILMTSMGTNSNSLIDIYGGVGTNPSVRIGHLAGAPKVNGTDPTGWGIYTDNGYFSGVIVSTSGKIANFTINGSKMYSNNHSAYNTAVNGIYIGDDYISFGSGGVTYFNSSGTGQVGPWTLTAKALYNTKSSFDNANAGVYIGTDYIAGGAGEKWWLKSDGSAKIGAMTLTKEGVLTVPAANVSGALTAATLSVNQLTSGTISSDILTSNNIVTDTITMGTAGSDAYIYVSKNNKSATINSESKSWRIILGNTFGVTETGYLSASSGKIGGWTIGTNALSTGSVGAESGIKFSNSTFDASINSTTKSDWMLTIGTKFGVDKSGALYANNAHISGEITATSGTIGAASAQNKIQIGTDTTNASIYYGMSSLNSPENGFYIGTDGISVGGGKFKVTKDGTITATGIQIDTNGLFGNLVKTPLFTDEAAYVFTELWKADRYGGYATAGGWTKTWRYATFTYSADTDLVKITNGGRLGSGRSFFRQSIDLKANTNYTVSLQVGETFYVTFLGDTCRHDNFDWNRASDGRVYKTLNSGTNTSSILEVSFSDNVPTYLNRIKIEEGSTYSGWSEYDENIGRNYEVALSTADTLISGSSSYASKIATNYITNIDSNGIWVTPSGKKPTDTSTGEGATGTKIDGTGVGIYVGGTKLAQYGTTTYFYEPDGTTAATLNGTGLNIKTGTITLGTNFSVTSTGVLTATGASIQGALTASTLSTGGRTSSASAAGTFIDEYGAIYGGSNKFKVTKDGILTATDANLNNLTLYDSNGNKRAAATTNGFVIYDGATTPTEIASFSATSRIGSDSSNNVQISPTETSFYNGSTKLAKIEPNSQGGIAFAAINGSRLGSNIDLANGFAGIAAFGDASNTGNSAVIRLGADESIEFVLAHNNVYKTIGLYYEASDFVFKNGNAKIIDYSMIQSGTTGGVIVAANTHITRDVSFSFSSAPRVTCSIYSDSTYYSKVADVSVWASGVTKNGCTIHFYNKSSQQLQPAVHWIATLM